MKRDFVDSLLQIGAFRFSINPRPIIPIERSLNNPGFENKHGFYSDAHFVEI
jgi:hypothetical protein